jgi:hypothetical protein
MSAVSPGGSGVPYPDYDYYARTFGDKRGIRYGFGALIPFTFALDVANPGNLIPIAGDIVYFDRNTTGTINVRFDTAWPAGLPMASNGAIRGIPFKEVILDWTAQAGRIATVWIGYGADIVSPTRDLNAINSITQPVTVQGVRAQATTMALGDLPALVREIGFLYAASFDSSANIGISASEQIIAAAANVNGVTVWDCDIFTAPTGPGAVIISLVAHTIAPVGFGDGQKLFLAGINISTAAGQVSASNSMPRSKFVPSGRGLWFFNGGSIAEGAARRRILYTIW